MMTKHYVLPLFLVDVIMIVSHGQGHRAMFVKALDDTHQYLHGMGARVHPDKSHSFASAPGDRKYLALHLWSRAGNGLIKVCNNFRYLGAMVSATPHRSRALISTRFSKAIVMAR